MTNVWVLSGGGAKGCFQAGAIHHLATSDQTYRPDTIAGTSVGAINSLLAAQSWEWPLQNIADLVDVWLSLEDEQDMFVASDATRSFEGDRFNQSLLAAAGFNLASLADFLLGGNYAPDESEFEGYEIDFFPPPTTNDRRRRRRGRLRIAARFLAKLLVPSPSINLALDGGTAYQLGDLVGDLGRIKSFYALRPIEQLVRDRLDFDEFRANTACVLKLVSTSVNNNRMGYMTRDGAYFQVSQVEPGPGPFSTDVQELPVPPLTVADRRRGVDRIISGTLASAAIPGAFPPELINGHLCFDGGVTDTLPTRAVVNDIAAHLRRSEDVRVISIACNPSVRSLGMAPYLRTVPRGRPSDLAAEPVVFSEADADGMNLLSYIPSLISAMSTEIDRGDDAALAQFDGQVERLDIAPTFNVNGTAQIDPGLIRIQLAYGWMRAFDVVSGAPSGPWSSDEITLARLHAWRLEELSREVPGSPGNRRFVPSAIPKIRQMKVFVKRRVEQRIAELGDRSMPRHQDKHFAWDERWYDDFERHTWRSDRTPWDDWLDMNGSAVPADRPPWA